MDICIIPRPLVRRIASSEQGGIHLNAILSAALLVAVFLSPSVLHLITELPHYCLFEHFLGVPCPGCSITLALAQLAHLHIEKSISANPGGIALALVLLFQVTVRLSALGRLVTFSTAQQLVSGTSRLFFSFLVLHWLLMLFNSH